MASAEHEHITGSGGRAPSGIQGQNPWRSPLKLKASWSLDVQRSRQNQSTAMKASGAKRNVFPGSCVSTGAKFPVAPVESAPMIVL